MTISNCVHPTNEYTYRQQFIEKNIEAIIAYYTLAEKRIIEGEIDVLDIYNKLRKNKQALLSRENSRKNPKIRKLLYKRIERMVMTHLASDRNYPDDKLMEEIDVLQNFFRAYVVYKSDLPRIKRRAKKMLD